MVVDGTRKFSGAKSLHYKTSGGGRVMLKFTQQFPIDNQHGRLMLYVPNKIASNNHWDMIQSHSSNPNHWELGGMYGNFELVVDPPDNGIDSKTPFPSGDKWHCIQWNFKHPDGLFVAKLNGQPVDPGPVMGRWQSGRWQDLTDRLGDFRAPTRPSSGSTTWRSGSRKSPAPPHPDGGAAARGQNAPFQCLPRTCRSR